VNNNVPSSRKREEEEWMNKDAAALFRLVWGGRNDSEKEKEAARANLYVIGMIR